MIVIVLDSSVVLKWSVDEPDSLAAEEIANSLVSGEIEALVPDLILYELTNALRLKVDFTPQAVERCLERLFDLGVEIIEPTPELMKHALMLARRLNTSVYDASYLALALAKGCKFVTADARFAAAARSSGACTLLADFERE
jgi:predicted nucleic acid-binding protein